MLRKQTLQVLKAHACRYSCLCQPPWRIRNTHPCGAGFDDDHPANHRWQAVNISSRLELPELDPARRVQSVHLVCNPARDAPFSIPPSTPLPCFSFISHQQCFPVATQTHSWGSHRNLKLLTSGFCNPVQPHRVQCWNTWISAQSRSTLMEVTRVSLELGEHNSVAVAVNSNRGLPAGGVKLTRTAATHDDR